MKRETKAGMQERLRGEGRWTAYLERRKELRYAGVTGARAKVILEREYGVGGEWVESAAGAAASALPPAGVKGGDGVRSSVAAPPPAPLVAGNAATKGDGPLDMVGDAEWVYRNLHRETETIGDREFPSGGAKEMHRNARMNPTQMAGFFNNIMAKVAMGKEEVKRSDRFRDDGRDLLGLIDRVERHYAASVVREEVGGVGGVV